MRSRPALTTFAPFAGVFAMQAINNRVGIGDGEEMFALAAPLDDRPWTTFTDIYAHRGLAYLLANALALPFVGPLVTRATTPVRFHSFIVAIAAS